jgi:hypothetical protein
MVFVATGKAVSPFGSGTRQARREAGDAPQGVRGRFVQPYEPTTQ